MRFRLVCGESLSSSSWSSMARCEKASIGLGSVQRQPGVGGRLPAKPGCTGAGWDISFCPDSVSPFCNSAAMVAV